MNKSPRARCLRRYLVVSQMRLCLSCWIVALLVNQGQAADAPATLPSKSESVEALNRKILRYILALDAPDPAMRERATTELIAIGPRVLKPLKEMLANSSSPEFKSRAKFILDELPRSWKYLDLNGGEVVSACQAQLRPMLTPYFTRGRMHFEIDLRNVGPGKTQVIDIRGFDLELPDQKLELKSEQADARIVLREVMPRGTIAKKAQLPATEKSPRRAIEVYSGGRISTNIELDQMLILPPGEYEMQVVYYAQSQGLLKDAFDDLRSNVLRFKVQEREN